MNKPRIINYDSFEAFASAMAHYETLQRNEELRRQRDREREELEGVELYFRTHYASLFALIDRDGVEWMVTKKPNRSVYSNALYTIRFWVSGQELSAVFDVHVSAGQYGIAGKWTSQDIAEAIASDLKALLAPTRFEQWLKEEEAGLTDDTFEVL